MANNDLTVSELTELIKNTLKMEIDKNLSVIGEISNLKSSKDNIFFTLKDDDATMSVVFWGNNNKKTKFEDLKNGKKVRIFGSLTVFSKSGTYILTAYKIELLGIGDLHQQYIDTKDAYAAKGYFDESIKKPLPQNINKIGIATALGGAALQDFIHVLNKNGYYGELYVKNCIVQGKECPLSITNGIKELDKMSLNVIVVSRGGGSFEDLYGFSNPQILEAIYNAQTCIISAVGHEIDNMLSDYVADIRAATPSIAGEYVSQKRDGMYTLNDIDDIYMKIKGLMETKLVMCDYELSLIGKIQSPCELIDKIGMQIDMMIMNLNNMINGKINDLDRNYNGIIAILNKMENINDILDKGFVIVTSINGEKISTVREFGKFMSKRKKLNLKFIDGDASFDLRNIKILTNE